MQILKVAGDHRFEIFAKECIKVGVELYNDDGYACNQPKVWALKPLIQKKVL